MYVRSRTARVMTTLMRNGRDRRSENPFWADAILERVFLVGTDQRITSGPAATAAASRWRKSFKRKQAGYMAAPERFAETSDSSCTAGAVHTWPFASFRCDAMIRRLSGAKRTLANIAASGARTSNAQIPMLHVGRGGERGGRAPPHHAAALDQEMAVGDARQRADVLQVEGQVRRAGRVGSAAAEGAGRRERQAEAE